MASRRQIALRATLLVVTAAVGYFAVPNLVGASRDLRQLDRVDAGYLLLAIALQALSLYCYALLARVFFVGRPPRLFTLNRIVLATTALSHVVPAGAAASTALGIRLLTEDGTSGSEAGAVIGAQALSSAVVLNVLLWVALLASLPDVGLHPVFGAVALVGLVLMILTWALVLAFTRSRERTLRLARTLGRRVLPIGSDRLEELVRQAGAVIEHVGRQRRLGLRLVVWAGLNWLLDALCLWCCLAAFGYTASPAPLFAAYGIAYVLAAIPLTPAGLGVVEVSSVALLVSFGLPHTVATLGVLAWRLVNFWLPIPLGALALASLAAEHAHRHRAAAPAVPAGPPS